ncbi:MAG: hypothetical protein U0105_17595 [Candidatus Obscuribacterales bacterium]
MSRRVRGCPYRDSSETWNVIVELLAPDNTDAKKVLQAVADIASSCIADQAVKTAPIIVTCDGPRTRIYCLYDDDALDQSDFNESKLGFDPLKGDWALSLPCTADDLLWVQSALSKMTARVSARDLSLGVSEDESENDSRAGELSINLEGFLSQ